MLERVIPSSILLLFLGAATNTNSENLFPSDTLTIPVGYIITFIFNVISADDSVR